MQDSIIKFDHDCLRESQHTQCKTYHFLEHRRLENLRKVTHPAQTTYIVSRQISDSTLESNGMCLFCCCFSFNFSVQGILPPLMPQSFLFITETEKSRYILSEILLQLRRTRTHVLSYAIQAHSLQSLNQNSSRATPVLVTQGREVSSPAVVTSVLKGAANSGFSIPGPPRMVLLGQTLVSCLSSYNSSVSRELIWSIVSGCKPVSLAFPGICELPSIS